MLFVPLPTVAGGVFSQRTRLGDQDYILRYRHNSRTDTWTIDLDAIGEAGATTPVMTGKKLFPGHDLLRQCFEESKPPGRLLVLNYDPVDQIPSATNLDRFRLVYLEPGETLGSG
jgi:hypothetical protein